jgi:hypothetical protein
MYERKYTMKIYITKKQAYKILACIIRHEMQNMKDDSYITFTLGEDDPSDSIKLSKDIQAMFRKYPCPDRVTNDGLYATCGHDLGNNAFGGEPEGPRICTGRCYFSYRKNFAGKYREYPKHDTRKVSSIPGADQHYMVGAGVSEVRRFSDGVYALVEGDTYVCMDYENKHMQRPGAKPAIYAEINKFLNAEVEQALDNAGHTYCVIRDTIWVKVPDIDFRAGITPSPRPTAWKDVDQTSFKEYFMQMVHQAKCDKCGACRGFNGSVYFDARTKDDKHRYGDRMDNAGDARISTKICCGYNYPLKRAVDEPCEIWTMRQKAHSLDPDVEDNPCDGCMLADKCSQQLAMGYGVAKTTEEEQA